MEASTAVVINGSPRVCGPQILIRAPGLTNLGDPCVSHHHSDTQNDLFHNSVKSCLLQQLQSVLLKFRNSHKSHFQHTSTAIHVSSTNDLAGLIVGVTAWGNTVFGNWVMAIMS